MTDFFDPARRRELLDRLARLSPDRRPAWGRFTAPRMVLHLHDSIRMAMGELAPKPRRLPMLFLVRPLFVHHLPFPRGAPTAPELLAREPGDWDTDLGALRDAIASYPVPAADAKLPDHPAFGPMDRRDWGVLMYRHADHHLKQFGI